MEFFLNVFVKIFNLIIDFLFPPSCVVCGNKEKSYICSKCLCSIKQGFDTSEINHLKICNDNFMDFYSLGYYSKKLKENIYGLKFNKNFFVKLNIVRAVYSVHKDIIKECDALICVPSYKKRSYHTFMFIKSLSFFSKIPFIPDMLIKIKKNREQKDLNYNERQTNVKSCFSLNKEVSVKKNSKILLFDDIITTGATLDECLKQLKDYRVYILTLGITPKNGE